MRPRFVPVAEWRDARHRLGWRGEQVAAAYLIACGFEVEHRRFRLGRHDLDLVVRRGALVVFVEVKTRRSSECGAALESVHPRKCWQLGRIAKAWVARHGRAGDLYRFDLVAVGAGSGDAAEIDHVPDAWRLESNW